MGLGSLNTVSLAEAREAALQCRKLLREGRDPIEDRRSQLASAQAAAARQDPSFRHCAEEFVAAHKAEWTNAKHAGQWSATLETYVYPLIGNLPVSAVDTRLVMRVLEPRWATKRETMSRVGGRIESILGWAATRQYREGDNPARWRGHLSNLLANGAKRAPIEHYKALPYLDLPAFMDDLRALEGILARSLEFLILTAARRDEVRLAQWAEIDPAGRIWLIPAARMKLGREHRVPLSGRAVEILQSLPRESPFVFPSRSSAFAPNMMWRLLREKMGVEVTVHGFRSTFADWAAEQTDFPREVREMALAHAVGDRVEAAYRRGDLFAKRRQLAEAWAQYCDGEEPAEGNVVRLAGHAG
jgi:integrase